MKLGLAAIALGASTLAWVTAPAVAQTVAQVEPVPPMQHHRGGMQALGLTEEQREEMRAIADESHQEILAVLTDEQREQLETLAQQRGPRPRPEGEFGAGVTPPEGAEPGIRPDRGRRGGMRDLFASLDLTDEQQERIREIREDAHERMQAVLTPEQREQIEEMRQNHHRSW